MRGRRRLGAKAVGSMGCDSRSRSLQRMVRRHKTNRHFLRHIKQITAAAALTPAAAKLTVLDCVPVAKTAEAKRQAVAIKSMMPPIVLLLDVVFIKLDAA